MSYDLVVYTRNTVGVDQIDALIAEGAGLSVDESSDNSWTVVRGARRRYAFTLDGPDNLEPEDIPAEVTEAVLGARYHWTVVVEGTAETEIPHAIRFARRLARALDGAVEDRQLDEIWTRSKSRIVQKPAREQRIAEVDLDWWCHYEHLNTDVVRVYLDAVTRYLPEALPRRFGEHEPLQGKYAEAGAEGFMRAWEESTSLLFFNGSGPCISGNFSAGPGEEFPRKFWNLSLTFHADPLNDTHWRDAVRNVFAALADDLPAFYATAEVTRGHIWSGRTSWIDGRTESPTYPVWHRPEQWMGLSPIPTWWTWLGEPYRDYAHLLPTDRVTPTAAGVLFEASEQPLARDQLQPISTWLPAELSATLPPNPHNQRPTPLDQASRIPPGLI